MGMSANRNGGMGQGMNPQSPMGQHPMGQNLGPAPYNMTSSGQLQPFQYPKLQMAAQNGPFGGVLAHALMNGLEHRRIQQGISPQDWQARLDAFRASRLPPVGP